MKTVLGIDVGGSTTKIVGFKENGDFISPMFVRATDQITAAYGAFGKFTTSNQIELKDISKIMVTGVGSSFVTEPIYGIPCEHVSEFPCIGKGGLFLSGLDEAIVISMGTGTALVYAKSDGTCQYLGGTGVGGGTLLGLSERLIGVRDIDHIIELSETGDLSKIDLRVSDITKKNVHPGLAPDLTASNFGNVSELARKSDLALGLINMIFETVGMLAFFASKSTGTEKVVITGNMATLPKAKSVLDSLHRNFGLDFIIPENASFGTVIGAALS